MSKETAGTDIGQKNNEKTVQIKKNQPKLPKITLNLR